MKIFKTNLVQAQEDIQEMNEMIAIIESYQNKIVDSMATPSKMLGGYSESSSNVFPNKSALIKIDVTKLP